jgi:hypothetical protein
LRFEGEICCGNGERTYGEEGEGVHSLAGDDCYELHFAEEGDFGGREAWGEGEGHCSCDCVFIGLWILCLDVSWLWSRRMLVSTIR